MDRNSKSQLARVALRKVALRKESVDRNDAVQIIVVIVCASLSARRAWIEIDFSGSAWVQEFVALRKESVDRNPSLSLPSRAVWIVALRKESVDRNNTSQRVKQPWGASLSARRAWIEIWLGTA